MIHWRVPYRPQQRAAVTREMVQRMTLAFSDAAMLENARLVVWTKGQMRGLRAALLRTKRVDECRQRTT